MMEATVKERLIKFLKYKKLSQAKFEKQINAANGFVNNISRSIGGEKLQRISQEYPELDSVWLLTGEGSMLRESHRYNNSNSVVIGDNANTSGSINNSVVVGDNNKSNRLHYQSDKKSDTNNSKIEFLEAMLAEKDKIIAEKERMIQFLMQK